MTDTGSDQEHTHLLPTNVWQGKQQVARSQKESRMERKVSAKADHDCGQLGSSQCCLLDLLKLWRVFPFKTLRQCGVQSYKHIL